MPSDVPFLLWYTARKKLNVMVQNLDCQHICDFPFMKLMFRFCPSTSVAGVFIIAEEHRLFIDAKYLALANFTRFRVLYAHL